MQATTINPGDGLAAAELEPSWLELPDPCLLAALRCCAAISPRTLLSAARVHSRLRQAAALVLDSIDAKIVRQEQVDSVQLYLSKHGQHVGSLSLEGVAPGRLPGWRPVTMLCELPANLPMLRSVSLTQLRLQLQPAGGYRGVLSGAVGAQLKRLELHRCVLLDGEEGLAAALEQLPGLEHLDMSRLSPTATVTADMLSGAQHLTCLQLHGYAGGGVSFEPRALAGMTQLQHLELVDCSIVPEGAAGTAELLHQLQHLQQLSHLILCGVGFKSDSPPAAAYSALTASSKLQVLGIHQTTLPTGVWEHVFPAGRQLPHLRTLDTRWVSHPIPTPLTEAIPLVSCCVSCCQGLHTLRLGDFPREPDIVALAQLTGLRELDLWCLAPVPWLLRLTRLTQLTRLEQGMEQGIKLDQRWSLSCKAPGDEPVWQQLLRRLLKSRDPEVARQAAAAAGLAGLALEPAGS